MTSLTTILIASVAQFIFGAVWYSALFGPLWGRIHGFDKLSKEVQQEMMKSMGPLYFTQFVVTIVTTYVLAMLTDILTPLWSIYELAALLWLGFVLPMQISGVIFGGTEGKWITRKIAVQAGAALGCLMIAALILTTLA
jgi:Protein of unknown function (DUF1761)